jgi:hypothetical protein
LLNTLIRTSRAASILQDCRHTGKHKIDQLLDTLIKSLRGFQTCQCAIRIFKTS